MSYTIPYKYTYLVGCLIFMIPWFVLYALRKDLRKEMLFMSFFIAFVSFITAYCWWTIDWWRPETVTHTRVGIEDFILGFSNGGIAAVIYEGIYKKHFYRRSCKKEPYEVLAISCIALFILSLLFWGIRLTSFISSTVAMIVASLLITYVRRDLIVDAIASGLLMTIVSVPVYIFLIILSPGWVEHTWLFNYLSGITFIGIPIEDLVFYFLFGFVVGPLYEIWQGYRLRN